MAFLENKEVCFQCHLGYAPPWSRASLWVSCAKIWSAVASPLSFLRLLILPSVKFSGRVTAHQHQPFAPSVPLGWFSKEIRKALLLFLWRSWGELCGSNTQITPWALGKGYWDCVQTSSLHLHLPNNSPSDARMLRKLPGLWDNFQDSEITSDTSWGSLKAW